MGLTFIPSKVDGSIGRVVSDPAGEVLTDADKDFKVPSVAYERFKDSTINNALAIGLGDGSTVDSLEYKVQKNGVLLPSPSIKTGNYTILVTDGVIQVNSSGGAFNLTLPASRPAGWGFHVVDVNGSCGANNVTIVRAGSEKIVGLSANYVFAANFGKVHFWFNGTDYWILGS